MYVSDPMAITGPEIEAANVPEADHPEWNAGTAYADKDRVIVAATHRIYEAAGASTGAYPPDNLRDPDNDAAPFSWIEVSATNRFAAFDQSIASRTELADAVTYTIAPTKRVDTVAFRGLGAAEVEVAVRDPALPRRNQLTRTEDLANAAWFKPGGTVITPAAYTTRGGVVLDRIGDDGLGGSGQAFAMYPLGAQGAGPHVASVHIRSDGAASIRLVVLAADQANGAGQASIDFAVATETITANAGVLASGFERVEDGVWRIWLSCAFNGAGDTAPNVRVQASPPDWTFDDTNGVLAGGLQFEAGSEPTAYQWVTDGATWDLTTYRRRQETVDLSQAYDYFSYYTFEAEAVDRLAFFDLPAFIGQKIDVAVRNTGATAGVGAISIGRAKWLGYAKDGSEKRFRNFSRKERDAFGGFSITARDFAEEVTVQLEIPVGDEDRVLRLINALYLTPAFYFSAKSDTARITAYGFTGEGGLRTTARLKGAVQGQLEILGLDDAISR